MILLMEDHEDDNIILLKYRKPRKTNGFRGSERGILKGNLGAIFREKFFYGMWYCIHAFMEYRMIRTPKTEDLSAKIFLDGTLHPFAGKTLENVNPATGDVIGHIANSDEPFLEKAIQSAKRAQEKWAKFKATERGDILYGCANVIEQKANILARLLSLETGKAIETESRGEIKATQEVFKFYGGLASELKGQTIPFDPGMITYTVREPIGVVGAIIPWNVPLFLMALKIVPALVAGNSVIVKPSEEATFIVLRFAEILSEIVPPGLITVLPGEGRGIGNLIAGHPDIKKVSFTGSVETGKKILEAGASKLMSPTLELGGKSPMIILPDVDVEEVVDKAFQAMRFTRQGQSCSAASRIFVHRESHDDFVEAFKKRIDQLIIGDPLDPKTQAGALISKAQFEKVSAYIALGKKDPTLQAFECSALPKDDALKGGYFVRPTFFTQIENSHRLCQEEIFGPVTCVMAWDDLDQVITEANDTKFGLAATIWTNDLKKAHLLTQRLEAGFVQVNQCSMVQPGLPYGGFKDSGLGQEASLKAMLEHYTREKTIIVNCA